MGFSYREVFGKLTSSDAVFRGVSRRHSACPGSVQTENVDAHGVAAAWASDVHGEERPGQLL